MVPKRQRIKTHIAEFLSSNLGRSASYNNGSLARLSLVHPGKVEMFFHYTKTACFDSLSPHTMATESFSEQPTKGRSAGS
jgi:hypothetical protein